MFIVCEPIALGMEHVPFNTAFLKTIRLAFPEKKICFYADVDHSNLVKEQIKGKIAISIEWHHIVLPPRASGFFKRLWADFRTIKFLLEKMDENPAENVLVITGNASILWALKYYTSKSHKNKKVQVVIHGDFSTLSRTPRRQFLNPLYYVGCLKTALRLPGYQRLQHVVLEESVRNKILEVMPFLKKSLYVLDHPIPVDKEHEKMEEIDPVLNFPINFGYLGRATEKKGFSKFLEVACEITNQFPGKVKFHFIGRVSGKLLRKKASQLTCLNEIPGEERLNRSDYAERMRSLHYVCLFFDKYYEFCASGVLLDCIAWEKPIIASRLMMFKNIKKRFKDIGYLCSKNDIIEIIGQIISSTDSGRYKSQIQNMRSLKASRTPEALSLKFLELVKALEPKQME